MNRNEFNNSGEPHSGNQNDNGNYRNNEENVEQRIDFKNLLAAFKQHKKFIIGSIALCMAAALIYSYQVTPIYKGTGSIMIQETSQDRAAEDSELAALLNKTYGIGVNNTLENELQFLRSRHIALNMADEMLNHPIMGNGGMYPILWKSYPEDSTVVSQDTVVARIQKKISFNQKATEADLIQVAFESPSRLEAERMVNLAMETYANTSSSINQKTASSAVEFLEDERSRLKEELQESEQQLRSYMNTSNVVEVDAQTQELIKSLTQLETERQTVKADLVAVTSAIEEYEKRLENIKPGLSEQYSEVTGPRLERYQYQLAEMETQRTLYLSKNPGLKTDKNPPEAFKKLNREIAYMKDEIQKLTNQITEENDQYLSMLSNSGSGGVTQNIADLNQRLIELQAEKTQYEAKAEVLDQRLSEERQFFNNLPDNMMDLARLKRDQEISEQMYRTVSEQYNEMALWQKIQFGLGRIVDHAFVPVEPVKPNRKLYLLVSFLIGSIFSVGYLTLRNSFGDTIDSVQELKDRGYPVLGIIPELQKATNKKVDRNKISVVDREISSDLISVHDPISPGAEAFRRMNYNIIYAQSDDDSSKTILITSSTKGEGKTTTVSNLAVLLAEAKKRVIIVDTDLGKPKTHNMFGISRAPGVVDVIRGEVKLEDAIQSPPYVSNVDILPSGSQSTNPAAINQNPKFEYLLENLQMHYDFVLIDTAPYGIVTDAAPIMKLVDGIVVIARFRKTEEVELDHTLEYLHKIRANILGFAITAFDPSKSTDYYNRSSYYKATYNDYYSHTKDMMSF